MFSWVATSNIHIALETALRLQILVPAPSISSPEELPIPDYGSKLQYPLPDSGDRNMHQIHA